MKGLRYIMKFIKKNNKIKRRIEVLCNFVLVTPWPNASLQLYSPPYVLIE